MDENFVDKLRELYPDIQKQEAAAGGAVRALWMNSSAKAKMFKSVDYHLKLSDVPHEKTSGFRLNPEHFRDDSNLEDLR